MKKLQNGISVIMPTFKQSGFITFAIHSLMHQKFKNWELILINDASPDDTEKVISNFLKDDRIKYYCNATNNGLGACLNQGLALASNELIAYLPSDDIYYPDHLLSLFELIESNPKIQLVHGEMKFNYMDGPRSSLSSSSLKRATSLQLVQVLHRKTKLRWMERSELVTDDLNKMFWKRFLSGKNSKSTGKVSCEWVNHPQQRHKIIREFGHGGLYAYKHHYQVQQAIRFQSSIGDYHDEIKTYENFTAVETKSQGGLKILIVGELSYNPERIYALEQQGHTIFGLWIDLPYVHNAIGPLPFGNIKDVSKENFINEIKEIQPDVIYALLNFNVVSLANKILSKFPEIPFIWHFKESPFYCRQNGLWNQLIHLYRNADGIIFNSLPYKAWIEQTVSVPDHKVFILDGELPKKDWFSERKSPLLSDKDGEIHTVISGRPYGITPQQVKQLAEHKIHLHFYGNFNHSSWQDWIQASVAVSKGYLHFYNNCPASLWVKEFSQYDAGWLHIFDSENEGELTKVTWEDLNYPSRIATLAAAGLPMIQKNNFGHLVASQILTKDLGIGIYFDNIPELALALYDKKKMAALRNRVWAKRLEFTFDRHIPELIKFFRQIIQIKKDQ